MIINLPIQLLVILIISVRYRKKMTKILNLMSKCHLVGLIFKIKGLIFLKWGRSFLIIDQFCIFFLFFIPFFLSNLLAFLRKKFGLILKVKLNEMK